MGRNKMCIGGKKLCYFIYLQFYKKGIKANLNYSAKSYNFSMQCELCLRRQSVCGMQRKILDRWIVNRWIVHRELAQPFFHRTPPTAVTSVSTENIPANVQIVLDRVHPSFPHGYCLQEVNTIGMSGRRNQAVGLLLAA